MSVEDILKLSETFLTLAAAKKKKLDPKAKVRNRGTVCVPAERAKDKKDHFPINSEGQARNALARVHQYSKVPSWYKGSLEGLQKLVSSKVHSKYPSIGKSEKKSKKSSVNYDLEKQASNDVQLFINTAIRSLEALKLRYSDVQNEDLERKLVEFAQKIHHESKALLNGGSL